jgi:hypothetical protein
VQAHRKQEHTLKIRFCMREDWVSQVPSSKVLPHLQPDTHSTLAVPMPSYDFRWVR